MITSRIRPEKRSGSYCLTRNFFFLAFIIVLGTAASEAVRAATIHVHAGDDLQAKLNSAQPGDEVVLDAGTTFVGNFILPANSGSSYITVRSSRSGELPAGRRVSPSDAPRMARVVTPNGAPALFAPITSHHWRLVGLEVTQNGSIQTGDLIRLGEYDEAGPQDTLEEVPHHLVVERCYLHAFSAITPLKRGVALNSADTDILDSYIAGVKVVGQDTQAIGGWNGPGPYKIINNYLEGGGENLLFGGATPLLPNLIPSDIEVRRNYFFKPPAWQIPLVNAVRDTASALITDESSVLAANTTYYYRVAAVFDGFGVQATSSPIMDDGGDSTFISSTSKTTASQSPGAKQAIRVSWTAWNHSAASAPVGYRVYRMTNPPGADGKWAQFSLPATATSFTDNGTVAPTEKVADSDLPKKGAHWQVKNLFELKNAQRVVIEGNVFENDWSDAQTGFAILFTARPNDSGPAAVVQDVQFINNIVKDGAQGISFMGIDDIYCKPERPDCGGRRLHRVSVSSNLFLNIGAFGGRGRWLQVLNGTDQVTIDHNTVLHTESGLTADNASEISDGSNTGFVFRDNLFHRNYPNGMGVFGGGSSEGILSLRQYFPSAVFQKNLIYGVLPCARADLIQCYPEDNFYPNDSTNDTFKGLFVNHDGGNYRLAAGAPYHNAASDGTDVGANFDTLEAATAYTVSGQWPAAPTNLRFVTTSSCENTSVRGYLTWLDNSSDETGFVIEIRTKINGVWGGWTPTPAVGADVTNSGSLIVKVETQYRVKAVKGSVSSAYSNTVSPPRADWCEAPCTPPTTLIISEFRLRGPAGAKDEFIELYNNSDTALTVCTADTSGGWTLAARAASGASASPVFTVPNGTVIPGRGHHLAVNSAPNGYSLSNHPAGGGTTATGDMSYTTDIEDNVGVALFKTSNPANFTSANRLDAVGSTNEADALYKEGTGYPALSPLSIDYSFYRDTCGKGGSITTFGLCSISTPKDTNNNAADFIFADTNGTSAGAGQRLGAPGPENLSSPVQRNSSFSGSLLDTCIGSSIAPNRVRDFTSDPGNNSTFGTLDIRQTFTNNTGAPVTRLRFRVIDLTTFPAPSGIADLRPRTSTDIVVTVDRPPCGSGTSNITVQGTTLEQPASQPYGGGFNSSLSAGTVTLATPLANGASINVRFLLGIQQTGSYKFYINIEALP